jgi:VCBS repeat-containing protein
MGDPVSYTEGDPAVSVLPDFALADASQSYAGENVTFALDGTYGAGEVLAFSESTPDVTLGAISVQNGTVFKGDGTNASAIGNVDPTFDGDSTSLRVNFSNAFTNGDFTDGTTGWAISNTRTFLGYADVSGAAVTTGATEIGGWPAPVDYLFGPGNQPNAGSPSTINRDRASSPNGFSSTISSGRLQMTVSGASCSTGFCVVRGPHVISESSVYLAAGDQVSLDWLASASGDGFDVYGYLLNVSNGKAFRLIDETGNDGSSAGGTVNVTIGSPRNEAGYFSSGTQRTDLKAYLPSGIVTGKSTYDDTKFTDGTAFEAGNYKFVFVAGSYDDTGGLYLGATFSIDNIAVSSSSPATVNAANVQALARLLTYSNSNPPTGTTTRSLSFASSLSDTGSPVNISVTSVNDAPVLAAVAAHTYTDTSAVDTFTNHTGTLSATDEESDPISFGLTDGTVSGTTSTLTRALGTMTLNTTSGAFTFAPDQGAINALDADTSTSFTFTASDGSLSSSQTLTINIVATVDALPGPLVISSITPASGALTISFSAPASSGTSAILNYEYSTDGTTFFALNPASTSTSIRITFESDGVTELVNGTSYPVSLKAVNTTGASVASNSVTATPAVPAAPAPSGGSGVAAPAPTPTPTVSPRPTTRPTPPVARPNRAQPFPQTAVPREPSTPPALPPIAQPAGPSPELVEKIRESEQTISEPQPASDALAEFLVQNPDVGQITEFGFVAVSPAKSLVTQDGIPQTLAFAPNETMTGMEVEGADFKLVIGAKTLDGEPVEIDSSGSVVISRNQLATVEGIGYSPSSKIVVWLFSEPIKLGELETDAQGNFVGAVALPENLETGEHTIQVSGVAVNGETRSALMGLVVREPESELVAALNDSFDSTWVALILMGSLGVIFLLLALVRRRKKPSKSGARARTA